MTLLSVSHVPASQPAVTAAAIYAAARRLEPVVRITPLEANPRLSNDLDVPVLLKREDLQHCRSYKVRGAYNLIASLSRQEQRRGVVCASAGNHGQGVAFSCNQLGITGRIYLPANTPNQKQQRIADLGGDRVELIITGDCFDDAHHAALRDSQRTGAVYAHPFDDPRTIAGQGTVAGELMRQRPEPIDTVIVPVGGGGLLAGTLVLLKQRHPQIRVVGVEPAGAASMHAALTHGSPIRLQSIDTFVDGAAVRCVGHHTYPIVRDLVDELVAVPEELVAAEMIDLYQSDGIIAEPAGALATAAARGCLRRRPYGAAVVCILSGGNNDLRRYGEVLRRSLPKATTHI